MHERSIGPESSLLNAHTHTRTHEHRPEINSAHFSCAWSGRSMFENHDESHWRTAIGNGLQNGGYAIIYPFECGQKSMVHVCKYTKRTGWIDKMLTDACKQCWVGHTRYLCRLANASSFNSNYYYYYFIYITHLIQWQSVVHETYARINQW